MVTLDELCSAMDASGRSLTERAARDWWAKGILPRPRRRGLGRGIGTETYWPDPCVIAQAKAAYDFLEQHSRTYSAALHLWLVGFPIDLHLVRGAYQRLIGRHLRSMRGAGRSNDPGERVSALAASAARHITKSKPVPLKVLHDIADLASPYLHIFFGSDEEFDAYGLSELWASAEPYVSKAKDQAPFVLSDNVLETVALYFGLMVSLPAQREAIASANDYEMVRARRLLHFVLGHLRRMAMSLPCSHEVDDLCGPVLIALGRPAIPILIMVLRDDMLRQKSIPFLLDLAVKVRGHLREGGASANLPLIHYG